MLFLFVIVAVGALAIDLIFKAIFMSGAFSLIPGLLGVFPHFNYGAAFGIMSGAGLFLILLTGSIIVVGLVAFFYFRGREGVLFHVSVGLIIGGALGNLYDRIFLGHVRDFIKFEFINFPIFNMADVFLNVGMVMLVVWMLFIYGRKNEGR